MIKMKKATLDERRDRFMSLFDNMTWIEHFNGTSNIEQDEEYLIDIADYKENRITCLWLYTYQPALNVNVIIGDELVINETVSNLDYLDEMLDRLSNIVNRYFNA